MNIRGIQDQNASASVIANLDKRSVELVFSFTDEQDPQLKAEVSLELTPREARNFAAKLLESLADLGDSVKP